MMHRVNERANEVGSLGRKEVDERRRYENCISCGKVICIQQEMAFDSAVSKVLKNEFTFIVLQKEKYVRDSMFDDVCNTGSCTLAMVSRE